MTAPRSGPSRLTVLLGSPATSRRWTETADALAAGRLLVDDSSAAAWPFRRSVTPREPCHEPTTILIRRLDAAFPRGQTSGTQLVLTQPAYQLRRWLDWLHGSPQARVVVDLSAAVPELTREVVEGRGPWAGIDVVPVAAESSPPPDDPRYSRVITAFRQPDAAIRLQLCSSASRHEPDNPALWLSVGSAAMEVGDLQTARNALNEAMDRDAGWEAVHFELGKLWLRHDDTTQAAEAFAGAARLMPSFAPAFSNWGAALAELDRPEEALVALEQAIELDPRSHTAHNNRGGALRDLGRLADAEDSFRRVAALAPDFVFGHYNLGHVLFLQGRFEDSRSAYEQGLALDPVPQQRARLALACAAAGDEQGACAHGREALRTASDERRAAIRAEMADVLAALVTLRGTHAATQALAAVVDAC